jgi:hypothetical protein
MFDDAGVTSKLIVTLLSRTLVAYSSECVEDDVNAVFTRGGPPPGRGSWLDVIADALVPTQGDASSAPAFAASSAGYKVTALEYGGTDVNLKVRDAKIRHAVARAASGVPYQTLMLLVSMRRPLAS